MTGTWSGRYRTAAVRGVHTAEVTDKIALYLVRFRDYFPDAHGHERLSGGTVVSADRRKRQAELVHRRLARVSVPRSGFAGFRFPPEVITVVVRWSLRFGFSYRDVTELLAERSIGVDHVTIYRWVQRFTPLLIDAARPCRHARGDRWFVDKRYVNVAGRWV